MNRDALLGMATGIVIGVALGGAKFMLWGAIVLFAWERYLAFTSTP